MYINCSIRKEHVVSQLLMTSRVDLLRCGQSQWCPVNFKYSMFSSLCYSQRFYTYEPHCATSINFGYFRAV